jgi:ergothioneine biosynthesis protein EgtB
VTSEALRRFDEVRGRTLALAAPLDPEDQVVQSMPDASPTKWHLAHTTWFFETFVLGPHARGHRPFDARYAVLFNSYYDAVGERHPRSDRGLLTRPTLREVHAYRAATDERIAELLEGGPPPAVHTLVELGCQHEEQHQELLLTDVQHLLSRNPMEPAYLGARPPPAAPSALAWADHPGGVVAIGHEGRGFSFDNEGPRHDVLLRPFRIASRLTTNAELAEFAADGGYRRPELWLSDGWATVQARGWRGPLYADLATNRRFSLHGAHALDPHAPVAHLSFYEADAFARWAGARLPTEAEWEVTVGQGRSVGQQLGGALVAIDGTGALGGCWSWTASPYVGYPGYAPPAGAIGEYNGKFMCNQLVLRGGSCFTPPGHSRSTYRNFFPPDARWQVTGVRLARDLA